MDTPLRCYRIGARHDTSEVQIRSDPRHPQDLRKVVLVLPLQARQEADDPFRHLVCAQLMHWVNVLLLSQMRFLGFSGTTSLTGGRIDGRVFGAT